MFPLNLKQFFFSECNNYALLASSLVWGAILHMLSLDFLRVPIRTKNLGEITIALLSGLGVTKSPFINGKRRLKIFSKSLMLPYTICAAFV